MENNFHVENKNHVANKPNIHHRQLIKKKVILTNFGDKFDIQMTFIHKRLQIQKKLNQIISPTLLFA